MAFSPQRRRFLKRAGAATFAACAATLWHERGEADALSVTRRDLPVPGWPAHAAGLKVGQMSDFHGDNPAALTRTERAVQMMLAERPDIVCLTGDFITYKPARWAAPMARALAPLSAVPGGVFCVLGNHDWWSGGRFAVARHLSEAGFHVMRNRSLPLPSAPGVWVVGLDSLCVGASDWRAALTNVPRDAAKLLLVHEPDFVDTLPDGPNAPRFSLQLSGHSHAGQVRVPGLPPLHCPRWGRHYPEGWQMKAAHPVYTTRGIGMVGPQLRLFCPPEVTVLRLFPAASPSPAHVTRARHGNETGA